VARVLPRLRARATRRSVRGGAAGRFGVGVSRWHERPKSDCADRVTRAQADACGVRGTTEAAMNLFGKKKKEAPKLSDTIKNLRAAQGQLEKQEAHLDVQRKAAIEEAKKRLKAKDKRGAEFQLKRKKMFDKQIEQVYGKRQNLEQQIMALESASSNKDFVQALKLGRDAMARALEESSADEVSDVVDKIQEQMQDVDEIGERLAAPIGEAVNEDELEDELASLEAEIADEDVLKAPSLPVQQQQQQQGVKVTLKPLNPAELPAVPAARPAAVAVAQPQNHEDAEIAALQQAMH
jgi:hypothetical protein